MSGSFFVPQTPTPTKTDKAEWEQSSVTHPSNMARVNLLTSDEYTEMTKTEWYKTLMASSESDSEVEVLNEQEILQFQSSFKKNNNQKQSEDCGFDALDPPYVGDNTHQQMNEGVNFRYSKQLAQTQIKEISKDDCKLSPESEEELKKDQKRKHDQEKNKVEKISKKMKREARVLTLTNTPDARLNFVKNTFSGADKYTTLRAVDSDGIVYKRAILPDESVSHAFILSSNEFMFKLDKDDVNYKTPGARGIVNITREKRIHFLRLFEKTFAHDLP